MNKKIDFSTKISDITKLSNLSFSSSIYESKIKQNKDFSNIIFPLNQQISYQDYVYAK